MTAFQQMDSDLLADSNLSEVITYWRNASNSFTAFSAFPVHGSPNVGGQFADPKGAFEGSVFFKISSIPLGPQKGDLMTIPSLGSRIWIAQEQFKDASGDWAEVRIRLAPK